MDSSWKSSHTGNTFVTAKLPTVHLAVYQHPSCICSFDSGDSSSIDTPAGSTRSLSSARFRTSRLDDIDYVEDYQGGFHTQLPSTMSLRKVAAELSTSWALEGRRLYDFDLKSESS